MPQPNAARVPFVTNAVPVPNGTVMVPIVPKQQFVGKENKVNAQEEPVQVEGKTHVATRI